MLQILVVVFQELLKYVAVILLNIFVANLIIIMTKQKGQKIIGVMD